MSPLIKTGQSVERVRIEALSNGPHVVPPKLELADDFSGQKSEPTDEASYVGKHFPTNATHASGIKPPFPADRQGKRVDVLRMARLTAVCSLSLMGGGAYYFFQWQETPALVATTQIIPAAEPSAKKTAEEERPGKESVVPEKETPETSSASAHLAKAQNSPSVKEGERGVRATEKATPRVTRNPTPAASVSDDIVTGYQAYLAGDDAVAERNYRQATLNDPQNIDAWLGLAAITRRQGKMAEAADCYLRVLKLEPKNAVANAGLIAQAGQFDPLSEESRLKILLQQHPEAAFLHAELGDLYAEQGLWPSAQQSYFQAFHLDAENAEFAFNLAVSLDQMGKTSQALAHYQRTQELMTRHHWSIDKIQLEARITQLRNQTDDTRHGRQQPDG